MLSLWDRISYIRTAKHSGSYKIVFSISVTPLFSLWMATHLFAWIPCWLNSFQAKFILSGYIRDSSTHVVMCTPEHMTYEFNSRLYHHYATWQIFHSSFTSIFLCLKCRCWHNSFVKLFEIHWWKSHVTTSIVSLPRCLLDLYPACTDGLK